MTIAFASAGTVSFGSAGLSPAVPATCPNGALIVAFAADGANGASGVINTPSGYFQQDSRSAGSMGWYSKMSGGSESSPAFTFGTASQNGAFLAAFTGTATIASGSDLDGPAQNQTTGTGSSTNGIVYPALTVNNNNCLILLFGYAAGNLVPGTPSTGGSWNTIAAINTPGTTAMSAYYQIQTTKTNIAAGKISCTGSNTGALTGGFIVAIPMAVVGGTTVPPPRRKRRFYLTTYY